MIPQKYTGTVAHGTKRAQALGYPTANIELKDGAVSGIYAAEVEAGDIVYRAAAFADPERGVLEAHLIDFEEDLYGKEVAVTLYEKMRDSKPFADDEELARMIADDVEKVRAYFAGRP